MSYITRICHSSSKLLSYSSLCNFLLCLLATLKDLSRLTVPSRFYLFPTIPPPSILFPLFSSPPRWYSRDTLRFLFFFFFNSKKRKDKTDRSWISVLSSSFGKFFPTNWELASVDVSEVRVWRDLLLERNVSSRRVKSVRVTFVTAKFYTRLGCNSFDRCARALYTHETIIIVFSFPFRCR